MAETILHPHSACFGCPIRCARWVKIDRGKYRMEGPGPEYETLCAFGTMCLNDNLETICWINDLCNRYGLDTISTGASISFAMEAYEKGMVTKKEIGGIEPTWGNTEAIIALTHLVGKKEGFGAVLGQGTKKASEIIGRGSDSFSVHVKGLEVPMHDPRAFFSMAGTYATSTRGACHLHGLSMMFELGLGLPEAGITETLDRHSNDEKGLAVKAAQDFSSLVNSCVICYIAAMGMLPNTLTVLSEAVNCACGTDYSPEELLRIGERITNLQRLYNMRLGFGRQDDLLPKRLLEPVPDGPNAGKIPDLGQILENYYSIRGWDSDGVPTKKKLSELGLLDLLEHPSENY